MKKIISFSVWGDDKRYLNGCFANIELASKIYPTWQTRFYCADNMSQQFMSRLQDMGAEVVPMQIEQSAWEGLFWRFLPASENDVDIFISRDIDSRLNEREAAAVDEWLSSDKDIHAMRDHIEHNVPILGGMWGCRNHVLKDMQKKIKAYTNNQVKGSDQDFLRKWIWSEYKDKIIVHDRYHQGITIAEKVKNIEEYLTQRKQYEEYRILSHNAKSEYIHNKKLRGEIVNDEELSNLFPLIAELVPLQYDIDGNLLQDYIYDPQKLFGLHDIRNFPTHKKMSYGTHVGEIFK